MENRVSPIEERKLTKAIEKAATLASINDQLDRNKVLVDALKEEGVDKRFAKVASNAFNKRLTVLTFKKTADEHKADPFELSDGDIIFEQMGGELNNKTASVEESVFEICFVEAPFEKTASVIDVAPTHLNYEESVDYQTYQNHLESMIDKHAAIISEYTGLLESLDSEIKNESEALAGYFQKSANSKTEFTTLINKYGDAFIDAVKDYLPETTDFQKTASAAVLPSGGIYDRATALIQKRAAYQDILTFFQQYSKGVQEFCKSAAASSRLMETLEWSGLPKQAANIAAGAGSLLRAVAMTGLAAENGLENIRKATTDAMSTGLGNARTLYNAGSREGMAPGELLDSEFLVKDRFRDRMMAWSDMAADPQFSMYPAEQVFQATQKIMDMDTSLERPDRRELLRTQLGQLLAQNNRASTADMAALATTLRYLAQSTPSASTMAAAPIVEREKKEAPELPEFTNMLSNVGVDNSATIDRLARNMESAVAEADKERQRKADEAKERARTTKAEATAIQKERAAQEAAAAREQKELHDARVQLLMQVLKDRHMRISNGPNGLVFTEMLSGGKNRPAVPGTTYTPDQVLDMVRAQEQARALV